MHFTRRPREGTAALRRAVGYTSELHGGTAQQYSSTAVLVPTAITFAN